MGKEKKADPFYEVTFRGGKNLGLELDTGSGECAVTGVDPSSPGEKQGVQRGDVMVQMDGTTMKGMAISGVVNMFIERRHQKKILCLFWRAPAGGGKPTDLEMENYEEEQSKKERTKAKEKKSKKKPKPEHVDMLMKDPKLAGKFDEMYGKGAAKELIRRTGGNSNGRPKVREEHAQKLRDNPHLAAEFDRVYGPGTADSILGGGEEDDVLQLTLSPDDAPPAPEEEQPPKIKEKKKGKPTAAHIEMLLDKPSFAPKFDAVYGKGVSEKYLPKKKKNNGPSAEHIQMLREQPSFAPKFDAVYGEGTAVRYLREEYEGSNGEASRDSTEPKAEHIQMLLDKPSFAPKFDAVYGKGVSAKYLPNNEEPAQEGKHASKKSSGRNEPNPAHIQMLLDKPSFAPKFDAVYGKGVSEKYLPKNEQEAAPDIPQAHIDKLLAQPSFGPKFDAVYGAGAAQKYLNKQASGQGDELLINGHVVEPAHKAMLIEQPEMADVFDEKYGPGASAQILGSTPNQDLDDFLAW